MEISLHVPKECKGGRLWRYSEDQLSAVCWAFARICWHDAELFQECDYRNGDTDVDREDLTRCKLSLCIYSNVSCMHV